MFSIFMNIWDDDDGHILGFGSARDRIDLVYGKYRNLPAGRDSSKPRIYTRTVSYKILSNKDLRMAKITIINISPRAFAKLPDYECLTHQTRFENTARILRTLCRLVHFKTKCNVFSKRKTSSSWSFWLLKLPKVTSNKAIRQVFYY